MCSDVEVEKHFNGERRRPIILEPLGNSANLSVEECIAWNKWNTEIVNLVKENSSKIYINAQINEKIVSLSFDDAPDGKNTPIILDILKRYNIKASFSLVGVYVEQFPEITRRIFEEGHLIVNHTWKHYDLRLLNSTKLEKEVLLTENIIYGVTGRRPALIRPPYGAINGELISRLDTYGYKVVLWSLNTFDWAEKASENIIKNVVDNVRPGEIVLMHSYEDKEPTVEALPTIIKELSRRNYKFVDMAQALNIMPYKPV